MKTLPAALAAHIAAGDTTLAHALKVTREDGQVFGFTDHDRDAVVDGITYSASPGLDVSGISIAASAAVGNLELRTLHDEEVFTTAEILGGVWRNASFLIFRYNWASPSDGIDSILAGTLGAVEIQQNLVVVELHDLRRYLQQPVGAVSSKTCRYRLGSSDANDGGLCRIELDGSPGFRVTGSVTQKTDNQVFRDSSRTEADDWFGEGELTWLTGNNAGLSHKVKSFERGSPPVHEFTLALPAFSAIQVGDTYSAVPGCRKRFLEDCVGKFANGRNFGGEPHRKGTNDLTKPPEIDV